MSVIEVPIPRQLPELNNHLNVNNIKKRNENEVKNERRTSNNSKKRYAKKQNIASQNLGLSIDIEDLKEDIKTSNEIFTVNDFANMISQHIPSQVDEKIYIEGTGKFKAKNRLKVDQHRALEAEKTKDNEDSYVFTNQAVQIHKVFKIFSLFICGLFAGLSLWQIITSYILFNGGIKNFLDNYHHLSAPVQCLYYFLFTFCIIYTLDRYDMMNPSINFWNKILACQTGAICIIVYIVGLIFSLAISNFEYRMSFHYMNSTVINIEDPNTANLLDIWKILNLIRGLLVIIGWMIISIKPLTDRLQKALLNYQHLEN